MAEKKLETFVYDNLEVRMTGRVASKEVAGGRRTSPRIDTLIEIEPMDPELGSWKKWVRPTDLFLVHETEYSTRFAENKAFDEISAVIERLSGSNKH